MLRIMQANFDSALDARYAIAQGKLWGTFIHPLSELSDLEFLIALGETANIVLSYGTSYSSGMFMFGGGDSILRTDEPVYADRHCESVREVGIRTFLAVGPCRPPFPRRFMRWNGVFRPGVGEKCEK